jgi:gamma-glutamyl hercynylcysteine S-oxide synthase
VTLELLDAGLIRSAGCGLLAAALADSRESTLRVFAAYEDALRSTGLRIPYSEQVNPPLWELGHVGWFQEFWIGRNPQRPLGAAADPSAPRADSFFPQADQLYDSSRIEHTRRWQLPLPDADRTRQYLATTLAQSLDLLARANDQRDAGLRYFGWLALMHEDMHREAAIYMAQALGIDPRERPAATTAVSAHGPPQELRFASTRLRMGASDTDFAFDNELPVRWVDVDAFRIDRHLVDNRRYLAFVEDGGYQRREHWSSEGWRWRNQSGPQWPRYWKTGVDGWQRSEFGRWGPLDLSAPVVNLTLHEAQAWCHWAGRRLPTEAEWELAATMPVASADQALQWGQAWEWTSSTFEPYPSFTPHPYRDYSLPWFGSRTVLRGASRATHPRLRYPRYRNFFTAARNDIFAGFRSCAPDASG